MITTTISIENTYKRVGLTFTRYDEQSPSQTLGCLEIDLSAAEAQDLRVKLEQTCNIGQETLPDWLATPIRLMMPAPYNKSSRIQAIKLVRCVLGWGLIEAKNAVDKITADVKLSDASTPCKYVYAGTVPSDHEANVQNYLEADQITVAIKWLRGVTGWSLMETHTAVCALAQELGLPSGKSAHLTKTQPLGVTLAEAIAAKATKPVPTLLPGMTYTSPGQYSIKFAGKVLPSNTMLKVVHILRTKPKYGSSDAINTIVAYGHADETNAKLIVQAIKAELAKLATTENKEHA